MDNLKYIIESLLFVSDTPIMLKQIHYIMPDVSMSHIRKAVEELTQEYNERVGSFYLSNVAGGIQLRTRPVYKEWIKRFIRSRPMRLSRAALEALAIVAYKQPVTRSEVDKIRGVDSGAIMRTLVENKLIRIIGRKEVAGRPMLYTTSKRFLEVFDLNDLKDLPAPDDLEIDDADAKENTENTNNTDNTDNTDKNDAQNDAHVENDKNEKSADSVLTNNNIAHDASADKEIVKTDENLTHDVSVDIEVLRMDDNDAHETSDDEEIVRIDKNDESLENEDRIQQESKNSFDTITPSIESNGSTFDEHKNASSDDTPLQEENDDTLEMPINIIQIRDKNV